MIPSLEILGMKAKVDYIADYSGVSSDELDEQVEKVKSEIDKLAEIMDEVK